MAPTRAEARAQANGYATPTEASQLADQWTTDVLLCRTYSHRWVPRTAEHSKRYRYWVVTQVCDRCSTLRHYEMSERGLVYASWYTYPEGYLVPGSGRIAGEARDAIRVASVVRAFDIVEVTGKEAQELARSQHTRLASGMEPKTRRAS